MARARQARDPGLLGEAGAAFRSIGLTRNLIGRVAEAAYYDADERFTLSEDRLEQLARDLPDEWIDEFERAVSEDHAVHIRETLTRRQRDLETLANAGWRGYALQIVAGLTDPIELGVQIGTNALVPGSGLVGKGVQAANVMRRATTAGLVFGLTDAALMAAEDSLTPEEYSAADYALAVLASFTLGGALEYRSLRKAEQAAAAVTPHVIDLPPGFAGKIDEAFDNAAVERAMAILNDAKASRATADPTILANIAAWEKQFEIPAPIVRMSDGTLVYAARAQAEAAAEALQRKVDRSHVADRFQQQNIPAEFRTAKPEIVIEPMLGGAGWTIRTMRDGTPIDTMPYIAGTRRQRETIRERDLTLDKMRRDIEFDLLRLQAGDDIINSLTPKGRRYFARQIDDAATADSEFIDRNVQRMTPEEIDRLIDETEPDYVLKSGPRSALGAATPEDIAAAAVRDEAAQALRDGKTAFDFDASWAEGPGAIGKTAFAGARFSLAGRFGSSDDPMVRKLGRLLVEDVLPDRADDGIVRNSASEWKRREYNRRMVPVETVFEDAYRAWAKERQLRTFWNDSAEEDFFTAVTRTVRRGKGSSGNAHVEKAADSIRALMADMLETAKRHGVRNFDNIPTNPNYIHRWLHKPRIDRAVAAYGEDNVIRLIQGSLFSGHQPMVDVKLTRKARIAQRNLQKVEAKIAAREKQVEKLRTKFSGADLDAKLERRKKLDQALAKRLLAAKARATLTAEAVAAAPKGPIDPKLARRIAVGYYRRIQAIGEFTDIDRGAIFATDAREALAVQLRELVEDITEDEIAAVLGAFKRTDHDAAATIPRAKHRLSLDDTFTMALDDGRVMRFDDLLNNNARQIVRKYVNDILGAAAMSEIYRVTARQGELPATNWRALIDRTAKSMRESNIPEPEIKRTLKRLDTAIRHIDGRPLDEDSTASAIARGLRDWNTARLGGRFAIAQVGDLGSAAAHAGIRVMLNHIPTLRAVIRGAKSGVFDNELAGELQRHWAFGNERLLNTLSARFDFTGDTLTDVPNRLGRTAKRTADLTIRASGLAWIDANSRRLAAIGIIEKWSRYASAGRIPSAKRLAGMGLSEADAQAIIAQFKQHGRSTRGVLGKRMTALGIDNWDQGVAAKFVAAVDKTARRLVQQQDIGQMSQWMTTWWGRSIIQFRGFAIGAYEKHLLYNLHMRDWESAMSLGYGLVFGGMSYAAIIVLNSVGRDDREEYLAENLSPARLAAGAWQRSNTSSILPPFLDNAAAAFGFSPLFSQGRVSGLSNQLKEDLIGNPTADLLSSSRLLGTLRAPFDPNFSVSQADVRAVRNLLPFQNFYGVQQMIDALQYSRPASRESE